MKRIRKLFLSSTVLSEASVAQYIESFAELTNGWSFPKEKSIQYARGCGVPSCCVIYMRGTLPRSALHLTKRDSGGLYVSNIVPLESSQLSLSEYNAILSIFARELRAHAKADETAIRVSVSKENIFLRDLISGNVSWKLFNVYINAFPLSHHPLDTRRLDTFICAIARYSRKAFDADAFHQLLIEELDWPAEEAKRCRQRVELGLEVLAAYKDF
jgi:hypothetical protein